MMLFISICSKIFPSYCTRDHSISDCLKLHAAVVRGRMSTIGVILTKDGYDGIIETMIPHLHACMVWNVLLREA